MTSPSEVDASGRTVEALAELPLGGPLRPGSVADLSATSCGEGEEAAADGASTSEGEGRIARASTRFEVRIKPEGAGLDLLQALDEASHLVATCRNVGMRENERRDAAWVDAYLAEHGELPDWKCVKPYWSPGKMYSYPVMRRACPRLNTTVVAWLNKDVDSKWRAERFDVLIKQTKARPHCKPTHPIPIPGSCVKLRANDDGSATIGFRIYSTFVAGAGVVELHLVPRDARQREELGALLSGAWKFGQAVLSRHAEKRGRWFVRLTYTKMVPKASGAIALCIRRGMRSLLVGASNDEKGRVEEVDGGTDIVAFKLRMQARRKSLGHRGRGRGAEGHGVRRSIKPLMDLTDKEARYSKERCRQAASRLVAHARKIGASVVWFEDFSTPRGEADFWLLKQWPWYTLKEACANALEGAGIAFREVAVTGKLRRCPECRHEHVEAPIKNGFVWECSACGMKRGRDQVLALNMLADVIGGGANEKVKKNRRAALKAFASATAANETGGPLVLDKVAE